MSFDSIWDTSTTRMTAKHSCERKYLVQSAGQSKPSEALTIFPWFCGNILIMTRLEVATLDTAYRPPSFLKTPSGGDACEGLRMQCKGRSTRCAASTSKTSRHVEGIHRRRSLETFVRSPRKQTMPLSIKEHRLHMHKSCAQIRKMTSLFCHARQVIRW